MNKRHLPSKEKIIAYWIERLIYDYGKFSFDYFESEYVNQQNVWKSCNMCFACMSELTLERAHILPKCEGGSDDLDNLHMLCKYCHLDSEILSGQAYWEWFKSRHLYQSPFNANMLIKIETIKKAKEQNPAAFNEFIKVYNIDHAKI